MGKSQKRKSNRNESKNRRGGFGEKSIKFNQPLAQSNNISLIKENEAIAFINSGRIDKAKEIYIDLIKGKSKNHIVYGNLAAILLMKGKKGVAFELFKYAIKLKPDYYDALNNLGVLLQDKGDLDGAIDSYQKAIFYKKDFVNAYLNLGNIYHIQGMDNKAIDIYEKTLKFKPNHPETFLKIGNSYKNKGKKNDAITAYKNAIKYKNDFVDAYNNLGSLLQDEGELDLAISTYNKALKYKPNNPETHNNLGTALIKIGKIKFAIKSYKKAIEYKSNFPEAYFNLAIAFKDLGNINEAISSYQKAILNRENFPDALINLGNILRYYSNKKQTISTYKRALVSSKSSNEILYNISLTNLLYGDYKEGWSGYDYRLKKTVAPVIPHALPKVPIFEGKNLEKNNKLLVVSEQGLGDTIQFMRFILYLRRKGFSISFCAQTKLLDLIKSSGIIEEPLDPSQTNKIKEGNWLPLLSLPRLINVSPDNPLISEPYIRSDQKITKKWKNILAKEKLPIIGINWQGNPDAEKNSLKGRSMPLEVFSEITRNYSFKFLSLQKGFGSEQLENCSFKDKFVSCQDQINKTWNFIETTSIIDNCDLIITTDTYVAHLAGAMGKPTWCMLHSEPDWRWGKTGEETFWYPSIKLFRQKTPMNWTEVVDAINIKLKLIL